MDELIYSILKYFNKISILKNKKLWMISVLYVSVMHNRTHNLWIKMEELLNFGFHDGPVLMLILFFSTCTAEVSWRYWHFKGRCSSLHLQGWNHEDEEPYSSKTLITQPNSSWCKYPRAQLMSNARGICIE
jgi:hypothetical protein